MGNSVVLTSEAKLADIQTVLKYRPGALDIYADEEKTDVKFMVKVANDANGSIGNCVVKFANRTTDAEGKAQVTMQLNAPADTDVKEFLADAIGTGLANLKAVEQTVSGIVESIKAERDAVKASIEVA